MEEGQGTVTPALLYDLKPCASPRTHRTGSPVAEKTPSRQFVTRGKEELFTYHSLPPFPQYSEQPVIIKLALFH